MTLKMDTENRTILEPSTFLIPDSALAAHLSNVTNAKETSILNLPQNVSSNHGKRQRSDPKPGESRMVLSSHLPEVSQLTPHGMDSPLAVVFPIFKVMVHIFWEPNCCIPSAEYLYLF